MAKQVIFTVSAPRPIAQAIKSNGFIFISG